MAAYSLARRALPFVAALVGLLLSTTGSRTQCIPVEPEPTDCASNADCLEASLFCAKEAGDCDGIGTCEPRPEACPEYYAPVCGCDGETYDNPCFAQGAGTNVAHEGACAPPQEECRTNADCLGPVDSTDPSVLPFPERYCAKPPGSCDGPGRCEQRPAACPDVWRPVCGCDGHTYGNSCDAAAAGVNVRYEGECEAPPPDGCRTNADCADPTTTVFSYCAKAVGDCDGRGVCAPRPQACIMLYAPVCGCDGRTYSNACFAAGAGQSVAYEGTCAELR